MKQMILDILKALSIDNYIITEARRSSAELFFIRKKLDMRRMKDVTEYEVLVFNDFEQDGSKFRGASRVILFPGMDKANIEKTLQEAYNAAAYVKNPYYELYRGEKEAVKEIPSKLAEHTLAQSAEIMASALFAADTRLDAWLNSAEIFVEKKHIAITSSTGTDVSYIKYGCNGEFVAQSKEPQDVEQYFAFSYDNLDTEALTEKAVKALNTVRDRSHAKDCPKAGEYDVVLSGEHVATLLQLYAARANASMIYPHYSDWSIGTKTQGDITTGEALNLTLMPSAPYSEDGIPMTDRLLIEKGELKCIYGSNRYCRYLGIEPTGDYRRGRLDNGTVKFEDMKKGCLYPVSFSDFQMDPMSGHFGGEIRLAYLYADDGVKLLTGGSINGSMFEKQGQLVFSLEKYKDASYEGPFAVRIPGVNVSGK